MSDGAKQNEIKENKADKILEAIAELRNDVKHLTSRMDSRVIEISNLSERVKNLEIQIAVNDQKTNKNSDWFDYIFKACLVIIAGYVARKVGLK